MNRPTIIFIASPSYSGSTLLSRMLHAHPDIICVGELRLLSKRDNRNKVLTNRACTCGTPTILDCPFWEKVNEVLQNQNGLDLQGIDLEAEDLSAFRQYHLALFSALSEISGQSIFVDSSKNWKRLRKLRASGFPVRVIKLRRHIHGVAQSALRYDKKFLKTIFHHWYYYQKIYPYLDDQSFSVQYEELVEQPESVLRRLMSNLGLSFDPQQLQWGIIPHHYLGGNPMRYQKNSQLKLTPVEKGMFNTKEKVLMRFISLISQLPAKWQFDIFRLLSNLKKRLNR